MLHPSTAINISNLNGREIIVGDSINIPSAKSTFATIKSSTIKGTYITNPISNAVLSSLMIYAGATCHIVISSGVLGFGAPDS